MVYDPAGIMILARMEISRAFLMEGPVLLKVFS
jgi:hypothetical protein